MSKFQMFFGSPGSGKTTLAVKLIIKYLSNDFSVFTNIENLNFPNCYFINPQIIGDYYFPANSLLLIDEAGVCFNNRNFKSLPLKTIEYFKYHRHFKNDVIILSQSWEDVDITLRRLVTELYYIKKICNFTLVKPVLKFVTVDKEKSVIIDGYKFKNFFNYRLFYLPLYFKFFDSFSLPKSDIKCYDPVIEKLDNFINNF